MTVYSGTNADGRKVSFRQALPFVIDRLGSLQGVTP